jgi:hypothetical protein
MTKKEQLHAVIDTVGDEHLEELDALIRRFLAAKASAPRPGILAKLQRIQIEAPADFAANLDLYLSGDKRVEDSLP